MELHTLGVNAVYPGRCYTGCRVLSLDASNPSAARRRFKFDENPP